MQSSEQETRIKIFISYAHDDRSLRQRLEQHLSALKQEQKITIWQDQEISPGTSWNEQIRTRLKEADLILLLVSASFLASDYVSEEEIPEALARHKAGNARVIPIILRPVDWSKSALGQLQVLPEGAKPVTRWDDQDDALENVAQGIRKVVEEIKTELLRRNREARDREERGREEGKRLALAAGVNTATQSESLAPLKYAENDAHEMAQVLESDVCNFTLRPVLLGEEATSRDIKHAILELIDESTSQDFVCFYFSGRAQLMKVKGERQEVYLVTHDFRESQVERDPHLHLSLRWLGEMLYEHPNVGKILLILDCCYPGSVPTGSDSELRHLFDDYFRPVDAKKQTDRSRFILSATRSDAVVHEQDGHSIMTGLLLKALHGETTHAYDREGFLDIAALYTSLLKTMPKEQSPWQLKDGSDRFILAWRSPQTQIPEGEGTTATQGLITEANFFDRLANPIHSPSFDHTLCRDASPTDVNMWVIRNFFQKERVRRQQDFLSNKTYQELLGIFNLSHGEFFTYGAALCFGIRPFRWIEGAFTRCTCWTGNDRLEGWKDDQELRGSLLEQYELSVEFLRRYLASSSMTSAEGSVEEWEIPSVVLREAVANALIHREYVNQTSGVRVEIFDDRAEISSPGRLPDGVTIKQLQQGKETHYPIRNPQIARIFYLCNYAESAGTGIARMQREMRAAHLPVPVFDPTNGRTFNVVLRRPQHGIPRKTKVLPEGQYSSKPENESGSEAKASGYKTATSPFSSRVGAVVIKRRYQLLSLLLTIILIALLPSAISFLLTRFPSSPTTPAIGVINEPNNEQIGLSDGTYAFDTGSDRLDAILKTQAAMAFAKGDKVGAASLWNQAARSDTSDAEALIYLEDQRVLASGSPYITLVIGTTLTGGLNDVNNGRADLQGAYVAQKEYNDGLKLGGGRLVRLLIASAGSKSDYVTEVAEQIVQATRQDSSLVGVMGWPYSAYTQKAIPVLTRAHIPMVSSVASADSLSGISPYFFRVAPPNKTQAIAGAKYAEQQLHANRVALFVDPNNPYSSNLADDFQQQFVADGNQIVDKENYTVKDQKNLPAHLQNVLNSHPDLIYFSGYADDLAVLLVDIPASLPNLQVLGGDGLYIPGAYPSSARPGLSRLHFTAFAYPDEWDILGMNKPLFFSEYPADFNPAHVDYSQDPYGFTRADYGVILSYDTMYALLQGCQNVLDAKSPLTPTALRDGLTQITGAKAIQGVGGQISFGSNGDPIDKAVVVLYVDQDGHIHMLNEVQGCFVVGKCG